MRAWRPSRGGRRLSRRIRPDAAQFANRDKRADWVLILKQLAAVGDGVVGADQHDRAGCIRKAEDQHSRHERADLLRREIDYRGDLPADQRVASVMLGELCRGALDADFGPEIDRQLIGGAPRFRVSGAWPERAGGGY